jgi:hypothetical protein
MMTSRHGTKFRPSLSCSICRRRKVRCGKEKPACSACVRMNEHCEYDRAPGAEPRVEGLGESDITGLPQAPQPSTIINVNESSRTQDLKSATQLSTVDGTFSSSIVTPPTSIATPLSRKRTRSPDSLSIRQPLRFSQYLEASTLHSRTGSQGYSAIEDIFRPRYVIPTFWGFVPGQVSKHWKIFCYLQPC